MKVLILGKNAINAELEKCMTSRGIDTVVLSDAAEIVKFRGEPGAYTATSPAGTYGITSVIVTEPLRFEGVQVGSGLTMNLMDDDETTSLLANKNAGLKTSDKIVILLDNPDETPEYITARAISLAKKLAEKKKEVLFLSKVVKSGYGDNEIKYKEARNSGLTFFKYEKLALCYDEDADRFRVEANDGVFDLIIDTPYIISAAAKETPELTAISKKLRLYYKPQGRINDDKFFLYPAFTSRRGVYYLNPALVMPDMEQSLEKVMPSIIADMALMGNDAYQREIIRGWSFPEVDPNKCAFCYSCFRACPHGALEPDLEASAMKIIESACEACGTCIAICPGQAIKRKGPAERPAGMNKGAAKPGSRKCKLYCCENGAAGAFEDTLPSLGEYAHNINSEPVACGGSISTDMLADDFKNYETIIVACCVEDACRHMEGDRRACKQVLRTAELARKAGIANKRVEVINVSEALSGVMRDNILSILEGHN